MSFHMILGIDQSASRSDVKKAFRRLALEHHPDKGGDREKFMEIHRAYEALKDRPETMTITQEFVFEGPPERAYVFEDVTGPSPTLLGKKYDMEQAPKTGWQGAPRYTVDTETHGSRRRASAQASHHAPAASPPEIRRRAPPGYEMPSATADPFGSSKDPEDAMEDPLWSFFCMLGRVYGCCTLR